MPPVAPTSHTKTANSLRAPTKTKLASDGDVWEPQGRQGAILALHGLVNTDTMPGTFAQIGMEHAHRYGEVSQIANDIMIGYPKARPMHILECAA